MIRRADRDAVERFLRARPEQLEARHAGGDTPLLLAALYADAGLVNDLLDAGADATARNDAGRSAIHYAGADLEKLRALLERGADVNARSGLGNTPLILVARRSRSAAAVRYLLEHGAEVNARNVFGVSALMTAAASGDHETLRLLLSRGPEVNVGPYSRSALAPERKPVFGGLRTPLMWAAYRGDLGAAELLLDHGADVNGKTFAGTPLIAAARAGRVEIARMLLDRGADVDLRDGLGEFTPLLWAAGDEAGDARLARLLIERGAKVDASGGEDWDNFVGVPQTALMIASRRGRTALVETLELHGATARPDPWSARGAPSRRLLERAEPISDALLARSVAAALPRLEESALVSYRDFVAKKQACVSCHNQYLPLLALGAARSRGIPRDERAVAGLLEAIEKSEERLLDQRLEPTFFPAPGHGMGLALLSLHGEGRPASRATDAAVLHLLAIQSLDGRWTSTIPRPPLQSSDVGATALAARALMLYPIPGRRKELIRRVAMARGWLRAVTPRFTAEHAYRIMGLSWAGEAPEALEPLVRELVRLQREDGGWAQLPGLTSDAYATGQVLHALREAARMETSHPVFQRGLRFLLDSQLADGTWFVRRRAFPFQPTRRSGFPHGRDAWISASATSWAVLAIAGAIEARPPRPPSSRPSEAGAPANAGRLERALPPAATGVVDFATRIRPLLERSCFGCHAGGRARGGYRMDDRALLLAGGRSGDAAIVPGRSQDSPVVLYASGAVEGLEMPPLARRHDTPGLTPREIGALRAWIDQGAPWTGEGAQRADR